MTAAATPADGPGAGARAPRLRWPVAWIAAAVLAIPLSLGLFWVARDSGGAKPLCGDRPGSHYPACQLPAPWGTGTPPTTTGFTP